MKWDARMCLGVARVIAHRRGSGAVQVLDLPDERERRRQAIELIVADTQGEIALEHTQIESFGDQIASGYSARRLEERLGRAVEALPPGRFHLGLDPTAVPTRANLESVVESLAASISDLAPKVEVGGPGSRGRHGADIGTDTMAARLYRWPGPNPGVLDIRFTPPRELEELRAERAVKAVRDKMDKLLVAAGHDRLSVLVLEDRDIALSNRPLVAKALTSALQGREQPDMVFLVEVWNESAEGGLLKEFEAWFPAIDQTWWPLDLGEP